MCGADLSGYRKDARFCSGSCSAEGSRLRRLLEGQEVDGYQSLAERLGRARKSTERLLRPL